MSWRIAAALAASALGRGAARREGARRALHHRRAQLVEAIAGHAAAHALRGAARDRDAAWRADLADAARTIDSLAALATSLRALPAPARAPLATDLEALDRALAEQRAEVDDGLTALGPDVPKAA